MTQEDWLASTEQTLESVIKLCKSEESATTTLQKIQAEEAVSVNKISKRRHRCIKDTKSATRSVDCKYCGRRHTARKESCKAFGKICNFCKAENHFEAVCLKKEAGAHASTHAIAGETIDHESIDQITTQSSSQKVFARLVLLDSGAKAKFQVDSGSTVNILRRDMLPQGVPITADKTILTSWTNDVQTVLGTARIMVRNPKNNKKYKVTFHIVDEERSLILGLRASVAMDMITINQGNINAMNTGGQIDILKEIPGAFNDKLGSLPGVQHLKVAEEVRPHASPVRRVPHAIHTEVKAELDAMVKKRVFEAVDTPTPWESNMVVAKKPNGKLRICIGPQRLNEALQKESYLMPTLEDVLPQFKNARLFSVVDLKAGYWHVNLAEKSSLLTCMNTLFGHYKWLRLLFSLKVSSEIFQKQLHRALQGVDGVVCVADDIVVIGCGSDDVEARINHDARMRLLLERCGDLGIKLTPDKVQLCQKSLKFLGHIVTDKGLLPDPMKIKSMAEMKEPQNEKELKRFLGFLQYLSKFLTNLAEIAVCLREANDKGIWNWTKAQSKAFLEAKALIAAEQVMLKYCDRKKELTVQCDASDKAIGETLLQDDQPFEFSSRALRDAETRYAIIEKEILAIVWAIERYHQYTYGRHTTVLSDHRCLQRIML